MRVIVFLLALFALFGWFIGCRFVWLVCLLVGCWFVRLVACLLVCLAGWLVVSLLRREDRITFVTPVLFFLEI